ncbi:gamma-glutamylcyclotransferase family protein [Sphingomonas sp.]|uniref:gamma-glutamylcyclotransferase family protein n=1 Tax=Sphingomonas sp. TaxID=28214 RepID=UPI001B1F98EE|nr:gamma-glutamylcyclotransferase family protein [Sphingomonas sp.]MBO9711984.1 gamma-glutamylcyclotransferase [Sphingomonas sp.]
MTLLFFYGSLVRGQSNHGLVEGRARFLGEDAVAGTLVDLGDYPGAVLGGSDWILGEVFEASDPELLALLDDFEGEEYPRVETVTRGGHRVWVYSNPSPGPAVPGGDWRAHVAERDSLRA